jgi:hypothetical protein
MEDETYKYTQFDYQELDKAYLEAEKMCRPDEYQSRQNALTRAVAHFLLKPYWENENSLVDKKVNDLTDDEIEKYRERFP